MSEVIIIAGSNNKNLELAKAFEAQLNNESVKSEIIDLTTLDLPLYTPQEHQKGAPKQIHEYIDKLDNAKGVIVCAPEYNGGVPPVVTNFIAWISTSGDKDWRRCFNGKPAIVSSFSGGGGIHLLSALRQQLAYIGMNVLGRQIQCNGAKPINEDSIIATVTMLKKQL